MAKGDKKKKQPEVIQEIVESDDVKVTLEAAVPSEPLATIKLFGEDGGTIFRDFASRRKKNG